MSRAAFTSHRLSINATDASGTVSFTFKVVSGHTQPTLVRLRTSGGHTSSNIMTVTTEVRSARLCWQAGPPWLVAHAPPLPAHTHRLKVSKC